MRRLLTTLALGVVAALAVATYASGGIGNAHKLSARLTPKARVQAKGGFAGIYLADARGITLLWTLSYSGLSGRVTTAQIHKGALVLHLCGPCASGQAGSAILSRDVMSALGSGRAYVTVRTARNPGGEIRGQISLAG
jgi:CHRD domain